MEMEMGLGFGFRQTKTAKMETWGACN